MATLNGPEVLVLIVLAGGASGVGLTLAKGIARRLGGVRTDSREIEALRDEVAQLRTDLEQIQARLPEVDEIENRLDFTERLLAQARERGLLSPPRER